MPDRGKRDRDKHDRDKHDGHQDRAKRSGAPFVVSQEVGGAEQESGDVSISSGLDGLFFDGSFLFDLLEDFLVDPEDDCFLSFDPGGPVTPADACS